MCIRDRIEALDSGEIAGAGLDVFVGEEIHPGNPLLDAKNLIFSPHSAAQTREAVINMATMCVEAVSYTHLDVYKRQRCDRPRIPDKGRNHFR